MKKSITNIGNYFRGAIVDLLKIFKGGGICGVFVMDK